MLAVRWAPCAARGGVRGLAGHSKWANIKQAKGANDKARAGLYTKLSKSLVTASRICNGDRSSLALASAISRARDSKMPKSTIDSSVQAGLSRQASELSELMTYEGTLPGGVGVIVDALTDNRNRTAQDIRSIFKKNGGAMGAANSVAWSWSHVVSLRVARADSAATAAAATAADEDARDVARAVFDEAAHEQLLELALEHGADDVDEDFEGQTELEIFAAQSALPTLRDALNNDAAFELVATELIWRPGADLFEVADVDAIVSALDALDNQDDVTSVFHNAAL